MCTHLESRHTGALEKTFFVENLPIMVTMSSITPLPGREFIGLHRLYPALY